MNEALQRIEFWFDFASPYAYFAIDPLAAIAERRCRVLSWNPFLLGAVFKATGMQPLSRTPLRGDYARHDWHRLARRVQKPFRPPEMHPVSSLSAARAFYWIQRSSPDLAVAFARRTFQAYFAEGTDIGDSGAIARLAAEFGFEAQAVTAALELQEIKDALRAITERAIERGIFGSPFFVVDGEMFWGHDRLPMVDEWLETGGW